MNNNLSSRAKRAVIAGMSHATSFELRPAHDTDAPGIIALIASAYAEYPGCILDVEKEEPDLLAVATAFGSRGGNFWVAIDAHQTVVGCVGWVPRQQKQAELKKLYVSASARRRGLASRLVELVEAAAREHGVTNLELWSDTRFSDGHAFYRANGFVQQPQTRELFDLSNTTEYHFLKSLS